MNMNKFEFPAISSGASVKESIELKNETSKQRYKISVQIPPVEFAAIHTCPICTELAPGETARV